MDPLNINIESYYYFFMSDEEVIESINNAHTLDFKKNRDVLFESCKQNCYIDPNDDFYFLYLTYVASLINEHSIKPKNKIDLNEILFLIYKDALSFSEQENFAICLVRLAPKSITRIILNSFKFRNFLIDEQRLKYLEELYEKEINCINEIKSLIRNIQRKKNSKVKNNLNDQEILEFIEKGETRKFLRSFANTKCVDLNRKSMIHQAARYGRNDIIGFLFSQNVDVNKRELDVNFTPLMTAINEDMYHSAIYLINIGADVNLKDKDGNTALHYAVLMKSPLTILTLIQKGADINARDKDGLAPRDIAKFNGFYDELVTPYL